LGIKIKLRRKNMAILNRDIDLQKASKIISKYKTLEEKSFAYGLVQAWEMAYVDPDNSKISAKREKQIREELGKCIIPKQSQDCSNLFFV
jgi:hypothetical protein